MDIIHYTKSHRLYSRIPGEILGTLAICTLISVAMVGINKCSNLQYHNRLSPWRLE